MKTKFTLLTLFCVAVSVNAAEVVTVSESPVFGNPSPFAINPITTPASRQIGLDTRWAEPVVIEESTVVQADPGVDPGQTQQAPSSEYLLPSINSTAKPPAPALQQGYPFDGKQAARQAGIAIYQPTVTGWLSKDMSPSGRSLYTRQFNSLISCDIDRETIIYEASRQNMSDFLTWSNEVALFHRCQ